MPGDVTLWARALVTDPGSGSTGGGVGAAATGCKNVANTVACDDGNACTANDVCGGGKCVGAASVNCDDSNACTRTDTPSGTDHPGRVVCPDGKP